MRLPRIFSVAITAASGFATGWALIVLAGTLGKNVAVAIGAALGALVAAIFLITPGRERDETVDKGSAQLLD